jgi:hypothetical protein
LRLRTDAGECLYEQGRRDCGSQLTRLLPEVLGA